MVQLVGGEDEHLNGGAAVRIRDNAAYAYPPIYRALAGFLNYKQINIAVCIRHSVRIGAEQDNLARLVLSLEPLDHFA